MPGESITVELPPGMSEDAFKKSFASFQKSRVATQVRDKAVRQAQKDLIAKYKDEYDKLVARYMPKG